MKPGTQAARYPSPLRYPGGKGKIVNFLKLLILENDLTNVEYVEPYAGGASVGLSLLYEEYVDRIQINDLNPGVFHFWRTAVDDADWLCKQISAVALTMDEWHRQKRIYHAEDVEPRELAFATFYLNRTNRSGIIARGGAIGGVSQSGGWGIDARFNRATLCERIQKIAEMAPRIRVTNQDGLKLLKAEARRSRRRLLYLDPPYYLKGSRLYDNFYDHDDHLRVSLAIRALAGPWIVSYDAAPEIETMYEGQDSVIYTLNYSASTVETGTEMMFFSSDLTVPEGSPSYVSSSRVAIARKASSRLF